MFKTMRKFYKSDFKSPLTSSFSRVSLSQIDEKEEPYSQVDIFASQIQDLEIISPQKNVKHLELKKPQNLNDTFQDSGKPVSPENFDNSIDLLPKTKTKLENQKSFKKPQTPENNTGLDISFDINKLNAANGSEVPNLNAFYISASHGADDSINSEADLNASIKSADLNISSNTKTTDNSEKLNTSVASNNSSNLNTSVVSNCEAADTNKAADLNTSVASSSSSQISLNDPKYKTAYLDFMKSQNLFEDLVNLTKAKTDKSNKALTPNDIIKKNNEIDKTGNKTYEKREPDNKNSPAKKRVKKSENKENADITKKTDKDKNSKSKVNSKENIYKTILSEEVVIKKKTQLTKKKSVLSKNNNQNKTNIYEKIFSEKVLSKKNTRLTKKSILSEKNDTKKNIYEKILSEEAINGSKTRLAKRKSLLSEKNMSSEKVADKEKIDGRSLRVRMASLRKHRNVGLYVYCDNCNKVRYLPDCKDPLELPKYWYCDMNPDPDCNKCSDPDFEIPEDIEIDLIQNKFNAGSIVWARMDGYPWWPAMVDDDPDFQAYYWLEGESNIPKWYNVTFFDSKAVTRAWLKPKDIKPFKANIRNPTYMNKFKPFQKRIDIAIKEAKKALELDLETRLEKYTFMERYSPVTRSARKDITSKVDKNLNLTTGLNSDMFYSDSEVEFDARLDDSFIKIFTE